MWPRKIPSLVDLCIQKAIDNLMYISDVGETDSAFLEKILSHCTVDQLEHIENSTEGRDLSSVTDKMWKRFYEQNFGVESVNLVVKRMKQKQVVFKWRMLYEAKRKERENATQKSVDRLKQRYAEEQNKRQSRQVQICSKIPPSSNKRNFFGGSCSTPVNARGNLMKKAKTEFLNSPEVKVHAAMRRNALQRKSFPPQGISRSTRPLSSIGSSTASRQVKPLPKRY